MICMINLFKNFEYIMDFNVIYPNKIKNKYFLKSLHFIIDTSKL